MTAALVAVFFAPPALFGIMMLVDGWLDRRHTRRIYRVRAHRQDCPDCATCAEYLKSRTDHPTHRPGPPQEWL